MLINKGLNSFIFSIVANSLSVPVPFSGGSTSKEKCLSSLFLLSSSITVILILYVHLATKLQKKTQFHRYFRKKVRKSLVIYSIMLIFAAANSKKCDYEFK